jgi:hypothetical protein
MTEPDGKWMAEAIRRSDRRRLSDARLNLPELPHMFSPAAPAMPEKPSKR